ncbi:hypothetical protein EJ071_14855 [Mesorhizobium sp. M1B.F.Ca.ET.045.04.1.1]|nr:hypothetical protein EJ071_14855 [Mesorhizobium sp. M1B.F.Ca.ET.045.04.1.1]
MGSDPRLGSAGFRGDPRSWLRSLNVTRNIYAHHSRLWNRPSARKPHRPSASAVPNLAHIATDLHAQTRYYASAVMLKFLLGKINPSSCSLERADQPIPCESSHTLRLSYAGLRRRPCRPPVER